VERAARPTNHYLAEKDAREGNSQRQLANILTFMFIVIFFLSGIKLVTETHVGAARGATKFYLATALTEKLPKVKLNG